MICDIKTIPIGTIGYWRPYSKEPIIRKAKFLWLRVVSYGYTPTLTFCWEIAGIGKVTEKIEERYVLIDVCSVNNGYVFKTRDGADLMDYSSKIKKTEIRLLDIVLGGSGKYEWLTINYDSARANTAVLYGWKIDQKTQFPEKVYVTSIVETTIDGKLVGRIPEIDEGDVFATKEECLQHRQKCEVVDFDDGEPNADREPTKKELLDKWLDKQHMSLQELRDIINQ